MIRRSEIVSFIKKNRFTPYRSRGQNFLTDRNVAEKIIRKADIRENENIVEIGPGLGALTGIILKADGEKSPGSFTAIEIDRVLYSYLKETLFPDLTENGASESREHNVRLLLADALKYDFSGAGRVKIISNLPYKITSPLLNIFFKNKNIYSMCGLVQLEFFRRMNGEAGTKDHSPLSIQRSLFCTLKNHGRVSPGCFYPEPEVDSVIFTLEKKENEFREKGFRNSTAFIDFLKLCFSMRRKKLFNNLKSRYQTEKVKRAMKETGLDENIRAEQVEAEKFISLYNFLNVSR